MEKTYVNGTTPHSPRPKPISSTKKWCPASGTETHEADCTGQRRYTCCRKTFVKEERERRVRRAIFGAALYSHGARLDVPAGATPRARAAVITDNDRLSRERGAHHRSPHIFVYLRVCICGCVRIHVSGPPAIHTATCRNSCPSLSRSLYFSLAVVSLSAPWTLYRWNYTSPVICEHFRTGTYLQLLELVHAWNLVTGSFGWSFRVWKGWNLDHEKVWYWIVIKGWE